MKLPKKSTLNSIPSLVTAIIILWTGSLFFSGCGPVGPDYTPPRPDLPEKWNNRLTGEKELSGTPRPEDTREWWTRFNDPLLSDLISKSLEGNLDLKEAIAKVREIRAQRGISQADLYPALDGSAQASFSRRYGDTGDGKENKLFSTGLDAGWELDIFGGNRRAIEKMTATLEATEASLNDIRITVAAEIAINYIDLRVYQERLRVAKENLHLQNETFQLNQDRYQAGLSDELSVNQARYNLESTRARIPVLQASLESSLNRLAVLSGIHPGRLHQKLGPPGPIPSPPLSLVMNIPADTIRNRPDIQKAERTLAAKTAAVGEAVADQYPKFTLNGSIGIDALSADGLLDLDNRGYSYGPRISLPIFNAGAIRKNIAVQTAVQEQAFLQYEAAVLNALEEVENAIKTYVMEHERLSSLENGASAARKAESLSLSKYQSGLIDFSVVLDAQRSLLTFQDQMVESQGNVSMNLVRLFKALGCGPVSLKSMTKESATPQ